MVRISDLVGRLHNVGSACEWPTYIRTGEFPAQEASDAGMFLFDDVIMRYIHNAIHQLWARLIYIMVSHYQAPFYPLTTAWRTPLLDANPGHKW